VASVISQVQQQCANPETTSIGTENFARMCGADGGVGACPATLSNQKVDIPGEIYGGPGVAVDGLTPGPAAGTQLDYFHTPCGTSNEWWRVDFGVSRRVQRVEIRGRNDRNDLNARIETAIVKIGDSETHSSNVACGNALSGNQFAHTVTCDLVGRYLHVVLPTTACFSFSELSAYGPCACPAGQYGPSTGSGACVACPESETSALGSIGVGACVFTCPSNAHKTADGLACEWRPTTMPDIITIAAGGGHAEHTKALERMVHYKLGMPQFFDSEQINSGSWRLVRQNPAGSTTWHPTNDNLEGVDTVYGGSSYYGSRDHNQNVWSVPFNAPRPAHVGQTSYSYPDEMFISNMAMTEWVYFPRTSLVVNEGEQARLVYASNHNSSPHNLLWRNNVLAYSPMITTKDVTNIQATVFPMTVYMESSETWWGPTKGSLVFVRLKPIPFSGSSNLG